MTRPLTKCQEELLKAMPDKYYIENGVFKKRCPWEEETSLEFFILETYGE